MNIEQLLALCAAVIRSADNEGCTGDLTVVSKRALDKLEAYIRKHA